MAVDMAFRAGDWQDKNVLEFHVDSGQGRIFFLYMVRIPQKLEMSVLVSKTSINFHYYKYKFKMHKDNLVNV